MSEKQKKWLHAAKNFKAADKPRKAERVYTPPGATAQKAGMIFFWMIALFMFAVVAATLFTRNADDGPAEAVEQPENVAALPAAIDFAKGFAEVYFTWNPTSEGWTAREEALAPMLAEGVDPQAGLIVKEQDWNSRFLSAALSELETTGENQSLITLEVDQELTRTVAGKEQKNIVKHTFTVPVGFNEAYGVLDLPSFTAVPKQTELTTDGLSGDAVNVEVETNILNFLPTFFESYATDQPDKLGYFLSGANVKGLEGSKTFEAIETAEVIAGEQPGTYEVAADVIFRDPATATGYMAHYRLTVQESGDRYVVTKLNEGVE